MRPADILALAAEAGVTIALQGDRLKLSGDERPPDDILGLISDHRDQLLQHLSRPPRPASRPSNAPASGSLVARLCAAGATVRTWSVGRGGQASIEARPVSPPSSCVRSRREAGASFPAAGPIQRHTAASSLAFRALNSSHERAAASIDRLALATQPAPERAGKEPRRTTFDFSIITDPEAWLTACLGPLAVSVVQRQSGTGDIPFPYPARYEE